MTPPDRRCASTATAAVLCALSLAAASCTAESNATEIAASEVVARIEASAAPLLLDVRSPEEFASGHIPGALNIPHDQLANRLGEIEVHRAAEVVVYCEGGGRAARAADVLTDAGFREIRHLAGDMWAWREAGRPTE